MNSAKQSRQSKKSGNHVHSIARKRCIWDGYYYMFYIGFIHVDRAAIGLARSKDGITEWERYPLNPILAPDKEGFDQKAVYKPYVLKKETGWLLWYNGAMYMDNPDEIVKEQIGAAFLERENLWNV